MVLAVGVTPGALAVLLAEDDPALEVVALEDPPLEDPALEVGEVDVAFFDELPQAEATHNTMPRTAAA